MKRWMSVTLLLCVALLCCGCMQNGDEGDEPLPGTRYAQSGNASETMQLDPGLYRFVMNSSGSGAFEVGIQNPDTYGLIARGESPYSGSQVFGIYENGTYVMNVTAEDAWVVNVELLTAQAGAGAPLPFTLNGSGDDTAGWVDLPIGEVTCDLTNDGDSVFAVWLYNKTGHPVFDQTNTYLQPLHGHMGSYNGSVPVAIEEKGPYYLNVISNGNWSVSIS
ncbi:hypothetical protein J2129_001743 [Methanofollis sp. W23]|uniref:hypothetical protein n=1 Tax=Methanofollis sp. W23 TaxID=2817849 RepID=UPI001AE430D8|nr:hypothetical protein [Methanofollis sp. W23]MBP2146289.1 hypothetical protein [Methanofollis sp. W23]